MPPIRRDGQLIRVPTRSLDRTRRAAAMPDWPCASVNGTKPRGTGHGVRHGTWVYFLEEAVIGSISPSVPRQRVKR